MLRLQCKNWRKGGEIWESTEGGAVVDTFEGDEGGENEYKGKKKSEDKDGVEEGSIGNVARSDLDLHQVNKAIVVVVAVAWYGDASHARREVKLHRRSRRSPTAATTLPPPRQNDNDTHHAHTITFSFLTISKRQQSCACHKSESNQSNNRSRWLWVMLLRVPLPWIINKERERERERDFWVFFCFVFYFCFFFFALFVRSVLIGPI